jgi:hypothetical protein
MARYFARPNVKSGWIEDEVCADDSPMIPCLLVDGHEAVDTGLLDEAGNSIYRFPNPMGFGRDEEW